MCKLFVLDGNIYMILLCSKTLKKPLYVDVNINVQ